MAEPSDSCVPPLVTEYVKLTVPVGVPAKDETVAVSKTGWPNVVVVVFADNAVMVVPWVMVIGAADDVEPPLKASPL